VIGMFPEWFAAPQPDWPSQVRLTGFPLYDEADAHDLGADLRSFLDAGSAPLLFTPGTANRAAVSFFAAARDAMKLLQRRALFVTRYRDQLPNELGPAVRHEAYVPFSSVFPHCAAAVHHGGIGTCAQALAAGVPQVTMPLAFAQPDNAMRLWRLGVGRWVSPHEFRGKRVATELAALIDDPRVLDQCRHWASVVRSTDALSETCGLLESLIPHN